MPRRPRPDRFRITLTEPESSRWRAAAAVAGISLEQLVREAVELAIARGSTR